MNEMKKTKGRPRVVPRSEVSPFSLLIIEMRELHGLSMSQAAGLAGMKSAQLWAAYESGKREPTLGQANRMLAVFGRCVEFGKVKKRKRSTKKVESPASTMV